MKLKTSREKRVLYFKTTLRWIIYVFLIFLSFVIMTSGSYKKPILLLPVALCIAVNNDIMYSACVGALCGFLTDIACGRLLGYNAVIFTVFCIAVTLFFELYLRKKFINYLILTVAASFLQCWLDYKFYFEIWGYENVDRIFRNYTLRIWAYTAASSFIIYFIFRIVNNLLMPKEHLTIEEVIRTN